MNEHSNSTEDSSPGRSSGNADNRVNQPGAISAEFSEDEALAIVQRADVTAAALAHLARNPAALKSRKVVFALATHARTPRHISIPLLRRMFTFDLVKVALTPTVAADIKRAAEEQILIRIESLSTGHKITLARRGPGRVAAGLLMENDRRVVSVALENGRLTELAVVACLMRADAPPLLFEHVSEHAKWSQRREVQIALLRSEKTPLEQAIKFAVNFSADALRDIVPEARQGELLSALAPPNSGPG